MDEGGGAKINTERVNHIYRSKQNCKKTCKAIFSGDRKILAQDIDKKLKMVKKSGNQVAYVDIK